MAQKPQKSTKKPLKNRSPEVKNVSSAVSGPDSFFLDCKGLKVWQVCAEISKHFNVNILVFDDIKEKEIYGSINGLRLGQVLDSISWFLGVEWLYKDDVYYVGGNAKNVAVFDSAGISQIDGVFDTKTKIIGDKIVASGSERELSKVSDALKKITDREFVKVHLYGVEVNYEKNLTVGIEIEKALSYAFSWEGLIESQFNPIQSLVLSINASIHAESDLIDIKMCVDTDLGMLSGSKASIKLAEELDRSIYTVSAETGSSYISSYSTQTTGLLIDITPYKKENHWYFDISLENSDSRSDTEKVLTKVETTTRLTGRNSVLVAKLHKKSQKFAYEKGCPFLADIPYLGYFFRVTYHRDMNRTVYFYLHKVD